MWELEQVVAVIAKERGPRELCLQDVFNAGGPRILGVQSNIMRAYRHHGPDCARCRDDALANHQLAVAEGSGAIGLGAVQDVAGDLRI
jgi:hypothetical protein